MAIKNIQPTKSQINTWLSETRRLIEAQPESTWTIARLSLVYPGSSSRIQRDVCPAAGACQAHATAVRFGTRSRRIEIDAEFKNFELRGRSSILGPFEIDIQEGKAAVGRFRQRFADSLWPVVGSWTVPFVISTKLGRLIPRPSDDDVVLRSAEPGEYGLPPIGVWFEKWDPIHLVLENEPDGPTIAICDNAMHCMINAGKGPSTPTFYQR